MSERLQWQAGAAQWAALACLAICSIGCSDPPSTNWAYNPPAVVDRAGYDEVVAAQRGKVVLVDFWATWCGPCLMQLPHTIQLAREHGDKLAVVTVSMDDPASAAQVQSRLLERGADKLINLISKATGPQGVEAFEIDGGALPHYKLYDRRGNLRRTFALDPAAEKQFTPEDVAAAVAALVEE